MRSFSKLKRSLKRPISVDFGRFLEGKRLKTSMFQARQLLLQPLDGAGELLHLSPLRLLHHGFLEPSEFGDLLPFHSRFKAF